MRRRLDAFRVPASLAYRAAVVGLAGSALLASGLLEQSGPHAVVGVALVAAALRTLRVGARLLDDRIVVRNTFRSYHVRWQDVGAVETVGHAPPLRCGRLGPASAHTVLRRRDGRPLPVQATQRVDAIGAWSAADEPTAVVDAAWRRATAPPRGIAPSPL